MRLRAGAATDVGQVRSLNEDGVLVTDTLCAVADGMGGHRGGEVASAMALDALRSSFAGHDASSLISAIGDANAAVHEYASGHSEVAGMGTTICAVAVVERDGVPRLCIANIGDSRAYVMTDGVLRQVSEDHSLVETLVREGRLSVTQAAAHPRRNVVTRALGIEPDVTVDAWEFTPNSGDRVLLCSDGLFNEVATDEIVDILANDDPQVTADRLVDAANRRGARDNVSAVVVVVDDGVPSVGSPDDRLVRLTAPVSDLGLDEADAPTEAVPVIPTPAPSGGPSPTVATPTPVATTTAAAAADASTAVTSGPDTTDSEAGRSFNWRVVAFVGAVALIMLVAFGGVVLAARGTYFVKLDNSEVVIYQGRPGGLLWFDPTVVERSGIAASQLPNEQRLAELGQESGVTQPSRAAADAYLAQLSRDIADATSTTTTTTVPETVPATVAPTAGISPLPTGL